MIKITNEIALIFGYGYNCNGYIITANNGDAILIDSGLGRFDSTWGYQVNNPLDELLTALSTANIKSIVLTHAHLDHSGGVASLQSSQLENINVYCHDEEKEHLTTPNNAYISPLRHAPLEPLTITKSLAHENHVTIGDLDFTIFHTPGHTEGSMCLFEEEKKWLFSGDCVFPQGSFGRVDFPGSNSTKMLTSLEFLTSLDVECLFAGHMEPILTNASQSIKISYQNAKSMI